MSEVSKAPARREKIKGTVIVDLTGEKFGRLTAVYPTDRRSKKGSVYWHCVCECGNETDVDENGLVHGTYSSCGCKKRELNESVTDNLTFVDGTCIEWLKSRKSRNDNTSGMPGVYTRKDGKYYAMLGFKGKRYYLGSYETFDEAVSAREKAEEEIHGAFLKAYDIWNAKDPEWKKQNPLIFNVIKKNRRLEAECPLLDQADK